MALSIEHRAGAEQASAARDYFHSVAEERVRPLFAHMQARQALFYHSGLFRLALRIRCVGNWLEESKRDFLGWLLKLDATAQEVHRHNSIPLVRHAVEQWCERTPGQGSFLVEQLRSADDLNTSHAPKLLVAVIGNRLKMLSSDELLFTELADGIFGLALAGKGSYLIQATKEDKGNSGASPVRTEKGR